MATAFERRMARARATTTELVARSQRVIWCFEPEKMPAMIDLLIAQGRLSESDRPCCVHWMALKRQDELSQEEVALTLDADEMLENAGIRTLTGEGWEALLQGADTLDAFLQNRAAQLDKTEFDEIRKLGEEVRRRELSWGADHRPPDCISHCK
jgi:hypothetical protein